MLRDEWVPEAVAASDVWHVATTKDAAEAVRSNFTYLAYKQGATNVWVKSYVAGLRVVVAPGGPLSDAVVDLASRADELASAR